MIKKLFVKLLNDNSIRYEIKIGANIINSLSNWLPRNFRNVVIITDKKVLKLYAESFAITLKNLDYNVLILSFSPGENFKNYKTKIILEEKILDQRYSRTDTIILAFGGGIVGDMGGFVAATYMRGIPYIQLPTTLLAMVDSSVGGKVGINTRHGKNLIGTFWHPLKVVADTDFLKSLNKQHLTAGLIEAIKMFFTNDIASLNYFKKNIDRALLCDSSILDNIIYRAVKIKSYIVCKDEKENNMRMTLNFGHTIGHALEKISNYKMLHGYAVGYGILVESKIAELLGILSQQDYEIIKLILERIGIKGSALKKYSPSSIIDATQNDKKSKLGKVRYVLLKSIGKVYITEGKYAHPVDDLIVKKALLNLQGR